MGTWTVECEGCSWLDGETGPALGARFEGHNRYGERTWTTICVIDELVPDRRFSYHVEADGEPITRWHITLRSDGDGTVITEGFERLTLPDATERAFENDLFGGRVRRNLDNIKASLERLAHLLEGG